jgi:uncharacterized protein (TIGR03435 family)
MSCVRFSDAGLIWLGVCALASGASVAKAQATAREPARFEVASIRTGSSGDGLPSMEFLPNGGVRATNVTLKLLIEAAYDIRPEQLSGGPGWTDAEEYSVMARGPEGGPASAEFTRQRLQTLLQERFHLALKLQTNPAAGYVLTVAKTGNKMAAANDDATHKLIQVGSYAVRGQGAKMGTLARFLSVHLQATVEDRTGLEGEFNFELRWRAPAQDPNAPAFAGELPEDSLVPAVESQLGLRLERLKIPTDRYTIERVERMTAN